MNMDCANAMPAFQILLIVLDVKLIITTTLTAHVCMLLFKFVFYSIITKNIDCDRSTCNDYGSCNATGLCKCDNKGLDPATNCSKCLPNHYNYPSCVCMFHQFLFFICFLTLLLDCDALETCGGYGQCNNLTGSCMCEVGFNSSTNCQTCEQEYHGHPTCKCEIF